MSAVSKNQKAFDEEFDVVVVGFGTSGSVSAIEAAEHGARVLVIDRWGRGGASARSGGIIYAGGGSVQQQAAGFHDDPDQMERYLALEEGVPVDDARLSRFCHRSLEDLGWLEARGVEVPMGFDPTKTVVPVDDQVGLYFSGNEKHFADQVPAVARGHRVAGEGMSGHDLVDALHQTASAVGVEVRAPARLVDLITDPSGRVVGVEALVLPSDPITRAVHTAYFRLINASGPVLHRVPRRLTAAVDRFEERRGRRVRIAARSGVVMATGGFSFNHDLLATHAPAYARAMPLGTAGDDGSGIVLAEAAGAGVRLMDHCGASRFIAPPTAFCHGVLVDADGERICDESLYAATLSVHIAAHGSRAWLITDRTARQEIRRQIRSSVPLHSRPLRQYLNGRADHVAFPRVFGSINLYLNRVASPSLGALAARCGIRADGLSDTVRRYNEMARLGGPDPMGKSTDLVRPIEVPPFTAVPCHLGSLIFPAPNITLGGLDVDGDQRVRKPGGATVPGLYAVGRCAAGVASRSYVSGLSLADCVFSGRNAGMAVTAPGAAAGSGAVKAGSGGTPARARADSTPAKADVDGTPAKAGSGGTPAKAGVTGRQPGT
ncbi:MAG: FAD-binding protein [Acidimicrobiales bacterium]